MLSVDNLKAGYRRGVPVLHELTISVDPGEAIGIIGRNGSGKTCLALTLMGVARQFGGTITLGGRSLNGTTPSSRVASGLSLVPEGRMIFAQLTVTENLHVAAYGAGRSLSRTELAEIHGYFPVLAAKADLRAGSLSGGEQQWLTIARALVQMPSTVILDEPSLGLSPIAISALGDALLAIKAQRGVCMLVMEQNADLLSKLCSGILVLDRGTVTTSVAPEDATETVAAVLLGPATG